MILKFLFWVLGIWRCYLLIKGFEFGGGTVKSFNFVEFEVFVSE